jgi:hypothetical protein
MRREKARAAVIYHEKELLVETYWHICYYKFLKHIMFPSEILVWSNTYNRRMDPKHI